MLDGFWLVNDRDTPQEVTVTVDEDGDRLFARSFRLGPAGDAGRPSNVTEPSPVDGPGRYVVTARMDDRTVTVETADFVDGDERCLTVRFDLLNNGSTDWRVDSYREC